MYFFLFISKFYIIKKDQKLQGAFAYMDFKYWYLVFEIKTVLIFKPQNIQACTSWRLENTGVKKGDWQEVVVS
jgi:hypothetical protein